MADDLHRTKELSQEEYVGQLTDLAVNEFYSSMQRKTMKFVIEYVDDMYNRRLELAYNDKQKGDIEKDKAFIQNLNGTIALPKSTDGIHHILIAVGAINQDLQFISTIIHELTHIHDFMNLASEFCGGSYEQIEQHDLFKNFYFWTEFNAKRNGYSHYRKVLFRIQGEPSAEQQVANILGLELKFHYDLLLKDLREHQYDKDKTIYVYCIIQFLGRFSVWEDLFPDEITPQKHLPDYLQHAYGLKIIGLYETLRLMVKFDIAKGKLEQLGEAIDSLCK